MQCMRVKHADYNSLHKGIVRNMMAFDSPLLITKPVCFHARPAADHRQRTLSVNSDQQLITLLERSRRRKYLAARKYSETKDQYDEDHFVHVLSNLGVDGPIAGMHQRPAPDPDDDVRFRHSDFEVVSEVMLPTNSRTRTRNLKSQSIQQDVETHCYKEASALNRLGCSELADQVVHRAKVRLKKRQRRNLPSLKANTSSASGVQIISTPSSSPSKSKVTATSVRRQANNENRETCQSKPLSQTALFPKRTDVSRLTTINGLGRQLELMEGVNSTSSSPITTRSLKVVYWSDRQSMISKETGIPNVPPVTPCTSYSQCFKFVPSMSDVKSQRQLRNRLQDIATKLKQKSELNNDARSKEEAEKRRQKEAAVKLKGQQRSEIYALNKIMAKFEEQKFQAFISGKV